MRHGGEAEPDAVVQEDITTEMAAERMSPSDCRRAMSYLGSKDRIYMLVLFGLISVLSFKEFLQFAYIKYDNELVIALLVDKGYATNQIGRAHV